MTRACGSEWPVSIHAARAAISCSSATGPAPAAVISWPATTVRVAGVRALRSRWSTASSVCSHAVRPKRPSHARGIGSLLTIVPVASASANSAPAALLRRRANVSEPSSCASSSTVTSMVCVVSPASKVRVPEDAT